jgi:hypothetical protein
MMLNSITIHTTTIIKNMGCFVVGCDVDIIQPAESHFILCHWGQLN